MARLTTAGFGVEGVSGSIDIANANGTLTRDSVIVRPLGDGASVKADSAAGNIAAFGSLNNQSVVSLTNPTSFRVASRTYWTRVYFCFSNLPTVNATILRYISGASATIAVRLTTTGKFQLWNTVTSTQIGADSTAVVTADGTTWWRAELKIILSATPTITGCELQVNGVSVASTSGLTQAMAATASISMGWVDAPGANSVLNMDDVAVNDDTGANQNTWPGSGVVTWLIPATDVARGANWTAGAGGTTNLWGALTSIPPAGLALASATNASQIKNVASDNTGNYDVDCTSYVTAGIGIADMVTVVHPLWSLGCDSATATSMAMLLLLNPVANGGTESTGSTGAIAGTYKTNWMGGCPSAQVVYNPIVDLTTGPRLRIGKRTASTNAAMACLMGCYVEFVPGIPSKAPFALLQAVNRAATF